MFVLPINSFNAGEASPWLQGRTDLEKYGSLCAYLENFLVTPYGGVRRRPGLEYIDKAPNGARRARLLPFRFNREINYQLLLNNGKLRILQGGSAPGYVESGGSPIELTHPWADDELREVQIRQFFDVAYLVHPNHPVQKLSRVEPTVWTLEAVDWLRAPMKDQNQGTTTIAPSATTGTGIDLVASADLFQAGHVGARFEICHDRTEDEWEVDLPLTATADSGELLVQGAWQITSSSVAGGWTGVLKVQEHDGTGWATIRQWTVAGDRNITTGGSQKDLTRMRISYTHTSDTGSGHRCVLEALDGEMCGEVEITAVTDAQNAVANVVSRLFKTAATTLWAEGAFSDVAGYPTALAFHDGRLWFGGTESLPQTLFGSRSDDYENFERGADDNHAIVHPLSSGERDGIRWIVAERKLLVGTTGGEFVVGSDRDENRITPATVQDRRHSNFGSAEIQAVLLNDSVLYAQRAGHKLREYRYVFENDRYQAQDLTLLAEHITETGMAELAYQQNRDSIVWSVTTNGRLIGMTYEKDQNVIGWHRHITLGTFQSVSTIYGEDEEDEVWCVVERYPGLTQTQSIERMKPDQYRVQEREDKVNFFYADSGKTVTLGSPGKVVTGLDHLEGMTVGVLGDGARQPNRKVVGGQITAETDATVFTVGIRYASRLEPMQLQVDLGNGTSKSREARVIRLAIEFWKSGGGYYGDTAQGDLSDLLANEQLEEIRWRDTGEPMDDSPAMFTGTREYDFEGDYEEGVSVGVYNDSMFPMAITGLIPKVQFFGDDEGDD